VNKKTIYIIVAILAIVIVAVAAAALLMNNDDSTPAPEVVLPADATSLKFTVTDSTGATYDVAIQNVNKDTQKLRLDMTIEGEVYNYIIDSADTTKYAMAIDNTDWMELKWDDNAEMTLATVNSFVEAIIEWNESGTTYSFTAGDVEYNATNIKVNPSLDDSLFATS
jgi:acyl carrier protein